MGGSFSKPNILKIHCKRLCSPSTESELDEDADEIDAQQGNVSVPRNTPHSGERSPTRGSTTRGELTWIGGFARDLLARLLIEQ